MLRGPQTAALLLLLFLADPVRFGSSQSRGIVGAAEANHNTNYDEYYEYEDRAEDFHDYEPEEFESDEDDELVENPKVLKGRALRHRTRPRNGEDLHGSRDLRGKGGKGSGSYGRSYSRSFLDPDIEPRPFINCIPVPPGIISRSGSSKSKGSKGKGKGKGNRRRSRKRRSSSSRRNLKRRGKGGSSGSDSGSSSRSRNNGRMGMGGRGRRKKLPYCPLPTFAPTFLPTVTPIPTFTPLPTITPFPSFTPFPTIQTNTPAPSTAPSGAPSVSSRPSGTPSLSDAPSLSKQPSMTPSANSPGPTTRNVSARLGYGFFAGTTIRQPTTEEADGLIVETERFYSDILRAAYPSTFTSFMMSNIVETFDATGSLPVIWDFDAAVVFSGDAASSPTAAQVFTTMETANYDNYIMMYVWAATPVGTSIFFDTQRVTYAARGGTVV